MPQIIVTWFSLHDNRTCPICRALNGYQWIFDAGKDAMPDSLVHPELGEVWNLILGSHAHGHERFNCRCHIEPQIMLEDVLAKCVFLREQALAYSEPYIVWRGGSFTAGGSE